MENKINVEGNVFCILTCSVIVLLLDGLLECHHGWRQLCLGLVAVRDRDGVQIQDLVEAGALDHAIEFLDRAVTNLDIYQRTGISIINHLSQLNIDVTAFYLELSFSSLLLLIESRAPFSTSGSS